MMDRTNPPPELSDTPHDAARPLTEHLEELRSRLFKALLAVAVLSVACWSQTDRMLDLLSRATGPLAFLEPTEAFSARLKLALAGGTFLAAPILLFQAWRFVGVALTVGERRVALGALPASYLLFAAGAALGWFVVVPAGLRFLVGFSSKSLTPILSVSACLHFSFWLTFGLGLLFQLPVVIAALARWGLVRSARLKTYRRHALLGILVTAALLTPGPDALSQLLLAVPTYLLFEISLIAARLLEPSA